MIPVHGKEVKILWEYKHTYRPELRHYGVLGMKWGVRRYQNKDGTLTKAGKKRYNEDVENAKSNLDKAQSTYSKVYSDYNKKTLGGLVYNKNAQTKLYNAINDVAYAKQDLSDAKTKSKMNKQTTKSDRQVSLEQKYKDKGMTQAEAEIAAYKRIRTEKLLAITAGVTLTAAAAYVAYKHYDNNVDKIIKSGETLQNISTDSNKGVSDAFYASKNKLDNVKYRGLYGHTLNSAVGDVYETKIGINKDLKVASRKSATNALMDLVKSDKTYAKTLEAQLSELSGTLASPTQNKVIDTALKNLKSGKVNSKVYDAVNLALVDHSPKGKTISKGFYDTLKSKGYDAIKDMNDSKYSGYKSSNPLVVFNGASKTAVNNIRKLGEQEINKSMAIGYADLITRSAVETGAKFTAATLGLSAISKVSQSKSDDKIVREYREKHPGTNLSYKEIVRAHKRKV